MALAVAQRLTLRLGRPAYKIEALRLHGSIGIGVSTGMGATDDAEAVMQNASLAVREAKRAGGVRCCVFEPDMRQRVAQRGLLENELPAALSGDRSFAAYQPIVDLANGDPTGVEALVRWRPPTRDLMSPLEFIPIAEQPGLLGPLGERVRVTACGRLGVAAEAGDAPSDGPSAHVRRQPRVGAARRVPAQDGDGLRRSAGT